MVVVLHSIPINPPRLQPQPLGVVAVPEPVVVVVAEGLAGLHRPVHPSTLLNLAHLLHLPLIAAAAVGARAL